MHSSKKNAYYLLVVPLCFSLELAFNMKIKNRLWLMLLLGLLCSCSYAQTTATPSTPVIKLNVSGWSPNLKNYYIALFEELLVLAEPQFGPHELAPISLEISTKRAVLLLSLIHI